MNNIVKNFNPKELWHWFSEISKIPRGTYKEEKVMSFIAEFARTRNLSYSQDKIGNILIKKTAQHSDSKNIIILQAHSDMVWTKSADSNFDFETQSIEFVLDGDWLKANKTTLGADNGIGLASILAILDDKEISHPQIEALITVSEEQGLDGAYGLDLTLKGKSLINLDTEDIRCITIGSAGGFDYDLECSYSEVSPRVGNDKAYTIHIYDASGGHSGVDINKNRLNAIKITGRILYNILQKIHFCLAEINSKGARNAISSQSSFTILINPQDTEILKQTLEQITKEIKEEFSISDPKLKITLKEIEKPIKVIEPEFKQKLIKAIYSCPVGVLKINQSSGLVESSSNIGSLEVKNTNARVISLQRSSSLSSLLDVAHQFSSVFELAGFRVKKESYYNSWKPNYSSDLLKKAQETYLKVFGEKPIVEDIHAGLESAIIDKDNKMDKISIGPTIIEPHSPQEAVNIPSVEKYYNFLLALLKSL